MPEAPTSSLGVWFARVDAAEYRIRRRLNHGTAFPVPRRIFQVASRLGDGLAWYVLIVLLPCLYGRPALQPAVVMALTGLHYPTDVLAGAVLGALLGALGLSLS